MKQIFLIILILGIIQSCTQDQEKESLNKNSITELEKFAPQPDYSSPEKLVKSFWKYRIWNDTTFKFDTSASTLYRFYSKDFYEKETDLIKKHINKLKETGHYLSQSKIEKIETQSDSRVIVYVNELGYQDDESFDSNKYVIVKEADHWRIEDFFSKCWSCDGIGKNQYGSGSDCEYCKGLGWRSMIFIQ